MTALPFRLSCLAFAALLLPLAQAAFNPAIVSAEARWIVYADLDALRGSAPGRELVDALQKAQREATDGTIGLDIPKVLTTVGSLTAYGINLSKDPEAIDGALIAQGTADLRKIAESVLLQGTLAEPKVFSEVTDLPFPAYAINDPKAPESTRMQLIVAFPPEPIVLLSKSRAQLLKARDVFRGTAPSLAIASATSRCMSLKSLCADRAASLVCSTLSYITTASWPVVTTLYSAYRPAMPDSPRRAAKPPYSFARML